MSIDEREWGTDAVFDKIKQALSNDQVNEGLDKVQEKFIKNEQVNQGIDAVQEKLAPRAEKDPAQDDDNQR